MKEPDKVGIDTIKESCEGAKITKNEYYNPDPSGVRTGNGPRTSLVETLDRVSIDAENVLEKVCETVTVSQTHIMLGMFVTIFEMLISDMFLM